MTTVPEDNAPVEPTIVEPTQLESGSAPVVADHGRLRQNLVDMIAALDAGEFNQTGIRLVEFVDDGSWLVYPSPLA